MVVRSTTLHYETKDGEVSSLTTQLTESGDGIWIDDVHVPWCLVPVLLKVLDGFWEASQSRPGPK
jgi:hypothetical protein